MLMKIASFIAAAVVQGIPLLFGATGEILTEKSGNLNLGIPGIMYCGGISGIAGEFIYENACTKAGHAPNAVMTVVIPLVCALLGAALLALIYSFLTITLRANQNVTGLALTTFGVGIGNFFGGSLNKLLGGVGSIQVNSKIFNARLPLASKGFIGKVFFSYGFMVYLAIIIAIIVSLYLEHTKGGLSLRAVGESPATADAAGINVTLYKYLATCIGGAIAGLGGLYFVMDYTMGSWTNDGFGDRGWLAIAIVIFAIWKPKSAILSSFLFGGLYILCVYIPNLTSGAKELIKMMPYIVTIIVLCVVSAKNKKENQPPQSLGLSYFREER